MVARWDNIEILRAVDRIQHEIYGGGPAGGVNGLALMEETSGSPVRDPRLMRGFVQELHIARDLGLVSFRAKGEDRG